MNHDLISGDHIWLMEDGDEPHVIGVRMDSGDSGTVYVTREQALNLAEQLVDFAKPIGQPSNEKPQPAASAEPKGWSLGDLPRKLRRLADEWEVDTELNCDDLRSAANVIEIATRAEPKLTAEQVREAYQRYNNGSFTNWPSIAQALNALLNAALAAANPGEIDG